MTEKKDYGIYVYGHYFDIIIKQLDKIIKLLENAK